MTTHSRSGREYLRLSEIDDRTDRRAVKLDRCIEVAENPNLWMPQVEGHPFPANAIHREAGAAIAASLRKIVNG